MGFTIKSRHRAPLGTPMGSPRSPLGSPQAPRDHPGTSRDLPGTPRGAPGTPRDPLKTPFRNGNGHISTPVRRKSLLTIAFESSRRDLQLVSHWRCQNMSYFNKQQMIYKILILSETLEYLRDPKFSIYTAGFCFLFGCATFRV